MSHSVTAQSDSRICGLPSIVLQNDHLRAGIIPEIGGKIYELTWKQLDWNVLWQNPRVPPQPFPVEAALGDFWCGGWDDIFPTCDPCEYGGLRYPGLGELHQGRFLVDDVQVANGQAIAHLSAYTPISSVRAHKTVIVDGPVLRIRNEIVNLGPLPVDFLWGTHPAFKPSRSMTLHIPGKTGIVAQSSGPQFGSPGQRYDWPRLSSASGQITDMSTVYGMDAKGFCGHYVTDLQEGWYALEDKEKGRAVVVSFPLRQCPFIWLWLSYGGWRGHHVVIVEPYTTYPVNLNDAVQQGSHRRIEQGEIFSIEVSATCSDSTEPVSSALALLK